MKRNADTRAEILLVQLNQRPWDPVLSRDNHLWQPIYLQVV
jgi:hypothetical protein